MQNPTQQSPPLTHHRTTTTTTIPILLATIFFSLLLFTLHLSTTHNPPTPPPPFSDPYLFPTRQPTTTSNSHHHRLLFLHHPNTTTPPPPSLSYFITGSHNDTRRIIRLLLAVYHPRNHYLLHLDGSAPQKDRNFLARSVQSIPVFKSAQNVYVVGKPDLVYTKGSSSISSVLHGGAILLRLSVHWDWFINLSAADYPLVTQDGSNLC